VVVREVIDLEADSEPSPLRNSTLKSPLNDASRNIFENAQGKTTLVQPDKFISLEYLGELSKRPGLLGTLEKMTLR